MNAVLAALVTGVSHLALVAVVCGPVLWWTRRRRPDAAPETVFGGRRGAALLAVAAGSYLAVVVLTRLPRLGPFAELERNWQGQLLALGLCGLLLARHPLLTARDVGLRRPRPGSWPLVAWAIGGAVAVQLAVGPMGDERAPDAETFLNSALMPGLWEELFFRGVLWALIAAALPAGGNPLGLPISWAMVLTSLLFGLGHGVLLDPADGLVLDPGLVVTSTAAGVLFCWLRERADSVWPAIVLHNLINLSGLVLLHAGR
ncbi:CPBP family intramembrane glutamic endopeptidase [Streptomyces sp. DSM 44915]|uniref:CPBP family intramembrane glutamic endopeptidase n=1 Tax=Streptomyces chisholmiae TaxID=3075540 RepID=A0ABU2JLK2_9ACTN|nr:CPBP family intramembrane glutamic endopeptidase [Streptomyces sp. DSM 44915]MDT0265859.1 CPBP family intramembrane glutamic endopeptidase [Streptomyces sp. DSM 44915]